MCDQKALDLWPLSCKLKIICAKIDIVVLKCYWDVESMEQMKTGDSQSWGHCLWLPLRPQNNIEIYSSELKEQRLSEWRT